MATTSNPPVKLCVLAALAVLSAATPAAALEDCVDNEPRTVASGGTNGVNAVFAAHINDDPHLDVLTASANDDKIAWYESDGNTPPDFTEHVISTNADGASSVVAADLDNDGDMDVVSASANDDKVSWYESDGGSSPRFIERVILTTAENAAQVHVADYDGDGDLDILVASIDDDTIEICESDLAQKAVGDTSPPAFTEVIVSTGANGAASVFAVEIFDDPDTTEDDGIQEVLSASRLDDTVAWHQLVFQTDPDTGQETSEWQAHPLPGGADGATSVVGADVDGDDDIDVVAASNGDNKIAWWENQGGDPAVFVKRVISDQAEGASTVFAIDVEPDGDVDVISASRFDHKVAWYENLGGGDFDIPATNQKLIAAALGAAAVFAGDFDQDTDVDVLAASSVAGPVASNDKVAWHENDWNDTGGTTPPSFTERDVSGGAVAPEALLAVQVDGQNGIDVIAASSVDDSVFWYENDCAAPACDPAFTRHVLTRNAPQAQDLFWADLDGDLLQDVVAALAGDDSIAWYKNGEFGDTTANRRDISSGQADGASSVFVVNLDGDAGGNLDVVAASSQDDSVRWFENDGMDPPGFTEHLISNTVDGARSVFAVDVDGDTDFDVVTASSEDDSVRWFENDGMDPPGFTEHLIDGAVNGARDIVAGDVDGDMDTDIVVVSSNSDITAWFEQVLPTEEEPDLFVRHNLPRLLDFVRAVELIDVDGDSDMDIVTASSGDDSVFWHQHELVGGLTVFFPRDVSTNSESARSVAIADLDEDGALDIVTGFLFGIGWHRGDATEMCDAFDVTGDDVIDGEELALLGGGFGQVVAAPCAPSDAWWLDPSVDYSGDCQIDGDDLAILTSREVWANSTSGCVDEATCPPICAFTCPGDVDLEEQP